ncbi:T9SS type A sorting domain-containing protein [Tenacibaculum ovolyticum]|uniref:T9SS type A sorting domain-containing protein n=1 Tax=Tenacibaculum ovolyticum TaxID=104270 RepID=UPI0009ECFDFA|nr:T9SS type A sorting domain-containing protein [Tenacibaculum ovolyticum]
MKIQFKHTLILFTLLMGMNIKAQISEGGAPYFASKSVAKSYSIPKISMPPINLEKRKQEGKEKPYQFAYAHKVDINPNNSGTWYTLSNGDKYWVLEIESKGAKSLNFTFSDFYLPKGAKLFFYNKSRSDIKGAFTHKNNKSYRKLGIAPIKGDQIIIEYYHPVQLSEKPALQLATVGHDYKGVFKLAKSIYKSKNTTKAKFGESSDCQVNVACGIGNRWDKQIRSVVLYASNNGTGLASAVLINNTNQDRTPYLLTALHNVSDSRANPQTSMFIFNYQSSTCADPQTEPSMANSISGAEFLRQDISSVPQEGVSGPDGNPTITRAENAGIDFALLKLSSPIPTSYNAYYSGWNASNTPTDYFLGIHHPSGDIKKISFGTDIKRPTELNRFDSFNERQKQYFWEVKWTTGSTETGSSGSPLFNSSGDVIGTLKGGTSYCSNNSGSDLYVAFSRSLSFLKNYLAPGSRATSLKGIEGSIDPRRRSIKPVETESSISLFPNPVQNTLNITSNNINYKETSLDIFTISGNIIDKKLYSIKQQTANKLVINVHQLPKGVYLIKVNNTTKKFVISK